MALRAIASAVRREGLKMGIYFSLYEWYDPLYVADPDVYVAKHMVPQFMDHGIVDLLYHLLRSLTLAEDRTPINRNLRRLRPSCQEERLLRQ